MLVTLTKKVAGDYTGPALKITVHAYIIECIDNFDTGEEGCTLSFRTGKDGQVTYECVESHETAVKLWEEALRPPKFDMPLPAPQKKKPSKKKVVRSTGPLPVVPVKKSAKKKVVKKAVIKKVVKKAVIKKVVKKSAIKKVADKAAKKVVKKLLAKKSK